MLRSAPIWQSALVVALYASAPISASAFPAAGPRTRSEPRVTQVDSARLIERVRTAELAFLELWQARWLQSQGERLRQWAGKGVYQEDERGSARWVAHVHCMRLGPWHGAQREIPQIVNSALSARSYCPSWSLLNGHRFPDQSRVLDSALSPAYFPEIRDARAALIALIDSVAGKVPGDVWIAGQRVRFLLDQGLVDRALIAAAECRGLSWWCSALTGYAHWYQRDIKSADSVFAIARSAMTVDERCRWDEVSLLLDPAALKEWATLSCEARAPLLVTLWWLSDPLWSDPGNERRVEHDARRVRLMLRSSLERDETFHWTKVDGADALAQVVLRFGWPNYMFWFGTSQDRGQRGIVTGVGGRLGIPSSGSHPPFTTLEYDPSNPHVIPSWRAVRDPLRAEATDWALHAPEGTARHDWWPREHMTRPRQLLQAAEYQTAYLRRDSTIVLAAAMRAPSTSQSQQNLGSYRAHMIVSRDTSDLQRITSSTSTSDGRIVLAGHIAPVPALLGLEASSASHNVDVRTRFAIAPPTTLQSAPHDRLALSDLLFVTPTADARLPSSTDSAVAMLLPSTMIWRDTSIGIYWETYGAAPTDTIEISISVESTERPGLFQRLAVVFGRDASPMQGNRIRWIEAMHAQQTLPVSRLTTVHGRAVQLNLSTLTPGSYSLNLDVVRGSEPPVRSRRQFSIK